jgi:hypothetical protein
MLPTSKNCSWFVAVRNETPAKAEEDLGGKYCITQGPLTIKVWRALLCMDGKDVCLICVQELAKTQQSHLDGAIAVFCSA